MKGKDLYFIGIGGIAMAQAALLAQQLGYRVRGADQGLYPPASELLLEGGVEIHLGYDPSHLSPKPDLVIIGNALSRGNPEVEEVLNQRIPFISLPSFIKRTLIEGRTPLVVAGTHGKTTTSSLLAWFLFRGGLDPSFFIGGVARNFERGWRLGRGEVVVIEGDEYDSAFFDKRPKFVHYLPQMVILNDVEYDHADIYHDIEAVKGAFLQLMRLLPSRGRLILSGQGEAAKEISSQVPCPIERVAPGKWWYKIEREDERGIRFRLLKGGEDLGDFHLPLWGRHNLRNAIGAMVAAHLLGLPWDRIRDGLKEFKGVRRRLEVVGRERGVMVIDDFAHHPTAVRETLSTLKSLFPQARVWAIFEPRTGTLRRGYLLGDLLKALSLADRAILGSSPEVRGKLAFDPQEATAGSDVLWVEETGEIIRRVVSEATPGDVVVVMSSGSFDSLPQRLLDALRKSS